MPCSRVSGPVWLDILQVVVCLLFVSSPSGSGVDSSVLPRRRELQNMYVDPALC